MAKSRVKPQFQLKLDYDSYDIPNISEKEDSQSNKIDDDSTFDDNIENILKEAKKKKQEKKGKEVVIKKKPGRKKKPLPKQKNKTSSSSSSISPSKCKNIEKEQESEEEKLKKRKIDDIIKQQEVEDAIKTKKSKKVEVEVSKILIEKDTNNDNNNMKITEKKEKVFTSKTMKECGSDLEEVQKQFTSIIKGQDEIMHRIAYSLYSFSDITLEQYKQDTSCSKLILPMLFSGISGTGKTKTVEIIQRLFELDKSDSVFEDLTKYQDRMAISQFLGSPPGLVGYESKDAVPFKLLEAIGKPHKGPIEPVYDNNTLQGKPPKPPKPSVTIEKIQPPVILLHLEEFDKAHPCLFTFLMNFLENGILTTASGVRFELPDDVRLIVIFTANYGADDLIHLKSNQNDEALEAIKEHMEDDGHGRAQIARIEGDIYPFFQLDEKGMSEIKSNEVSGLLERGLDRRYIKKIEYDDEEIVDILKSAALSKTDPKTGARSVHSKSRFFKHGIFSNVILYAGHCNPPIPLPLDPNPIYRKISFQRHQYPDLKKLIDSKPHSFPQPVIRSIDESIARNDEAIYLLYLLYYRDGVEHILNSTVYYPKNLNINNNNVNNFNSNNTTNIDNIKCDQRNITNNMDNKINVENVENMIPVIITGEGNNIVNQTITKQCNKCSKALAIQKFKNGVGGFRNKCNSCRMKEQKINNKKGLEIIEKYKNTKKYKM